MISGLLGSEVIPDLPCRPILHPLKCLPFSSIVVETYSLILSVILITGKTFVLREGPQGKMFEQLFFFLTFGTARKLLCKLHIYGTIKRVFDKM